MVSKSHLLKDISTGRHGGGIKHTGVNSRGYNNFNLSARTNAGFAGINLSSSGVGLNGINQRRGGCPSCMGCNCCG